MCFSHVFQTAKKDEKNHVTPKRAGKKKEMNNSENEKFRHMEGSPYQAESLQKCLNDHFHLRRFSKFYVSQIFVAGNSIFIVQRV